MKPRLLTFDIFGTVVDWKTGLSRAIGRELSKAEFDRIVDAQGEAEKGPYRPYAEIVAASLSGCADAERIGRDVGRWPLFPDAYEGLRRLMKLAPCVAMTNSDRAHGDQVQEQLGFRLTDWVCAEDVRVYKPAPKFWHEVARRRQIAFGPHWWHVSAYADYDLDVAHRLGLTTIYLPRPHARPGSATRTVSDLIELASRLA